MTNKKRGRPQGAKGFTEAERDVIRLGLKNGSKVPEMARLLGRGRASVYLAIARMRERGTDRQEVLNLGQIEGAAHDADQ